MAGRYFEGGLHIKSAAIVAGKLLPRAIVALAITTATYALLFPHRSDYLGHYLAGFGGTAALLSVAFLIPMTWRPTAIVAVSLFAIALGWGTEKTVFRLAIFDPVDFFNQSLGAVVAAGARVGDEGGAATGGRAFGLGITVLTAGFYFAFA